MKTHSQRPAGQRIFAPLSFLLTLLALLGAALLAQPAAAQPPPPGVLELEIELDPAARQLQGVARRALPAGEFLFELDRTLRPQALELDGKAIELRPGSVADRLQVWRLTLPQAGVLTLRYGGELPELDTTLDHREVLRALPPMTAPAGSYLPAGSGWYPQAAGEEGYRVSISVPRNQRAIVPGRLAAESLPGDADERYRARFELLQPAGRIELMAGPWVVRERMLDRRGGEAIRLRTYFPRALDAEQGLADAYLTDSQRYIERYSGLIGPYPYDGFAVVAGPLPTGFGMPGMTYIGEQVLRLPFIRATSLAHEVLHNWWGNGVQVDYSQGNWSEGLTTFMADYAHAEGESAAKAREMRLGWLRDFAALPAEQQPSLAQFRSRAHGAAAAAGYGKAAMLFVMLQDRIGKPAFDRGIRQFWERHRFGVAGWADLQAAFEQSSGEHLQDFFEQWVRRDGGPEVKLENARIVSEGGRARLQVEVLQSAPAYRLRLPLQLNAGEHSETRWVEVEGERQQLDIALDNAGARWPQSLRLDPELRVWRRPEAAQLPPILRQWILAPQPRLAVPAPASGETRQAAAALATRLLEHPPQAIGTAALGQGRTPVLLIGLHEEIDAVLAAADLPPRLVLGSAAGAEAAEAVATAQVWTVQLAEGPPLAVISARDTAALADLQRPLPHYGAQSWLLFDGARLLERGVWSAPGTALEVQGAAPGD